MSDLRDQLESIADASPAPVGATRDVEIQQAVTRGLATPAREARRAWPWIVVATSVAAAAVIAFVVVRGGDGTRGDGGSQVAGARDAGPQGGGAPGVHDAGTASDIELVVERGNDAPVGAIVEASERTVLRAGDTRVEAKAKTRFARETADAKRWLLDQGELAMSVAEKTTLEVRTPEARLVGIGSRFVVGRYASQTVVEVQVGEVLVTPSEGEPVTVHAGETWPVGARIDGQHGDDAGAIDAGVASAPIDAGTRAQRDPGARVERDAGMRVPVLQFDATIIRKTIRAGKVGDAREMIEAQRGANASSKRAMAELGILAAEADLAERKTKSAIGKYLDVVRDYASTAQAEQALFAAAQLAIDRPDAGYKPEALLQDYLDTYPRGQFAKDAQRLLETLKK